jgi:NADH:ubiquinone oxidoreductase subunit 6 (subunit J)
MCDGRNPLRDLCDTRFTRIARPHITPGWRRGCVARRGSLTERYPVFMDLASIIFLVLAAVLVGSALAVVTLRNIVHAALFLVLVFGAAAGIYIMLNAEFIAIVQILIYAGAVTILILFAIMLTQNPNSRTSNPMNRQALIAAGIAALLCAGIIFALSQNGAIAGRSSQAVTANVGTAVNIGTLLYSPTTYSYVLPFEIATLVLLVAIVGAIVIGREEE